MPDIIAPRDNNQVPGLVAADSASASTPLVLYGDAATHALHVFIAGSTTGGDDINIAQVNGATVNVGTGAAGATGTLRVVTATDSTIGTVTTVSTVTAVTTVSTLTTLTGGGVASGATDSGNPIKVGGVYNSTAPTLTTGQRGDIQLDSRGDTQINSATLISGEDQTNNVMRVEGQFSGTQCTADTQVKASAGFLHSVTIQSTDAVPTAGTIIIYDNTAESGTIVCSINVIATATTGVESAYTLIFDRIMTTGIYCGFTTTNDVSVQLTWR